MSDVDLDRIEAEIRGRCSREPALEDLAMRLVDELRRTRAERADARASLAKVRADLDTLIATFDEVEADRDKMAAQRAR